VKSNFALLNLKFLSKLIFLNLVLASSSIHSQTIEGRVLNAEEDVANVHVFNLTTNKATITSTDGYFSIAAKLKDTIRFSAIQFTRKELVVNKAMLDGFIVVKLSTSLTELEEVVVWPYMLSGDLLKDMDSIEIEATITASTLDLPNANVKERIQSERLLYTARTWDYKVVSVKLDPLINAISGRTKMLKKRVARDLKESRYNKLYDNLDKSFLVNELKIPGDRIYDFYYYCESDSSFDSIVQLKVKGDILHYMVSKSIAYRKNNSLD
jgi:hypothetical protein